MRAWSLPMARMRPSSCRGSRPISSAELGSKKLPKAPEKMGYREREKVLATLEKEMKEAARRLDFEEAAQIRDMIMEIRAASRK